jgi:hypothetical protein
VVSSVVIMLRASNSNSNSCAAFLDYDFSDYGPQYPQDCLGLVGDDECPAFERAMPLPALPTPSPAKVPGPRHVRSQQKGGVVAAADKPYESPHVKTVKKLARKKPILGKVDMQGINKMFKHIHKGE